VKKDPLPLLRDEKGKGVPTPELWDWAWKGVRELRFKGFYERLGDHSGVDRSKVKPIFDVLRANRVVYPDNALNEWAAKAIGHEVARRFQGTRRLS
jgi:hypothetical protein